MMAVCKSGDKLNRVNGTLTLVRPQENKSLFKLQFTGNKGDVKGVDVNQTEAREVKKIEQGEHAQDAKSSTKAEDANVVMLRVSGDKNYDSVVMGSPVLDSAWILARNPTLDEKVYNDYIKFLEQNGFTSSKITKIDHSKCENVHKNC